MLPSRAPWRRPRLNRRRKVDGPRKNANLFLGGPLDLRLFLLFLLPPVDARHVIAAPDGSQVDGDRIVPMRKIIIKRTDLSHEEIVGAHFGSLGVIEGAWLRLRPRPERTAVFEASGSRLDGVGELGLAAARRATARAVAIAVCVRGSERDVRFTVELAGDAASVERDAAWVEEHCDAQPAEPVAVDRMRDLQRCGPDPSGLRFRIDALSSRLQLALEQLCDRCESVLVYPGLGLLYADVPLDRADDGVVESAFRFAARTARAVGGGFVCESAPAWAKRGRDVFGDVSATLPLLKALKQCFDPGRVLNPGRFAGGL